MDQNRWSFLAWNVRGLNSQAKWDAIRNKITDSHSSIVCLQETKRSSFDNAYLPNFCPRHLNKFVFAPSVGGRCLSRSGMTLCLKEKCS
jgi:exonuclease III